MLCFGERELVSPDPGGIKRDKKDLINRVIWERRRKRKRVKRRIGNQLGSCQPRLFFSPPCNVQEKAGKEMKRKIPPADRGNEDGWRPPKKNLKEIPQ